MSSLPARGGRHNGAAIKGTPLPGPEIDAGAAGSALRVNPSSLYGGERLLARLIAQQPRLFRMLSRFNYQPADYLHPQRRHEFIDPAVDARIWDEPRARRALSALILASLDLAERPCFEPGHKAWPIALLDGQRLLRLARYVGAVLLGPQARQSMSREEVLAWKEKLTPQAYQFVMNSASLLPQVKSGTDIDSEMPVEMLGYGWIMRCIDDAPPELLLRARLKCPPLGAALPVSTHRATQVVHAVFSTMEPRWISSFATVRP